MPGFKVDLAFGTATFKQEKPVSEADIKAAIERIGFTAGDFK